MKNEIKKYIELMYDQNSEFNQIEDLNLRKEKAAIKAKLNPNDPDVRNIMNLKNSKVNEEIFTFIHRNNSNEYAKLIADQQLFIRLQEKLLFEQDGEDIDKLLKISERSDELIARIKLSYINIYKHQEVIDISEKQIKMVTLEQRLKQKQSA